MTTLVLDRTERNNVKAQLVSKIYTVTLMMLGLMLAGNMLSYAVHHKLSTLVPITDTEVTVALREKQLTCLAQNIYREAGHEPFEGKVAVAQVVINRTKSGAFPDDICRTIQQKTVVGGRIVCQFSWLCENPSILKPVNPSAYNESMAVAKKVLLEGFRLDSLKDALYYHNDQVHPQWGKQKVAVIGHHTFYK
jgi:spore germination cell wall hydrolase CwlJ-like protein